MPEDPQLLQQELHVAPAQEAVGIDRANPNSLIAAIEVRRFKLIGHVRLDFGNDPLVLVGANNSGKSSVLHAAHFAVSVAQTALLVGKGIPWRQDKFELSFSPSQLLWSPVTDVMSLATGGVLEEQANRRIEITIVDTAGQQATVAVLRGRNRNIQVAITGRALGERLQSLATPFSVFTPGLAGIAREERYLSPGVVRRAVARGDANLVLRNVLLMLSRNAGAWQIFEDDMQSVFPGVKLQVDFDNNIDETITTRVKYTDGPWLPLDAAGTAVLQAAQILGYSALYNPPLILLDEPDSHLHPSNQRSLCRLLTRLARTRGFRLMISTHSRHVLDALRGSSKVIWMAHGAVVPDAGMSTTARLLDLGALDAVDYFADAETKCVVLTEDTSTEPLRALLAACGFVDADTRVASYEGCSKIDSATVLGQFITDHTNNVRVVVHRDRDFMNQPEVDEFEEGIRNCALASFVTELSDIEAHFVNAAHLAELNVGISEEDMLQMIHATIEETRDASIKSIINLKVERAYRARPRTGQSPDIGQIGVDSARFYDEDPGSRFRGKEVLGRLASKIQTALGANPRIFESTRHLVNPGLVALAGEIWPAPAPE